MNEGEGSGFRTDESAETDTFGCPGICRRRISGGVAREYDRREEFPKELWKKACELGFIGLFIKKEYGGLGLGFLEFAMVMEEFWRVDPGCGNILIHGIRCRIDSALWHRGTEKEVPSSSSPRERRSWGRLSLNLMQEAISSPF